MIMLVLLVCLYSSLVGYSNLRWQPFTRVALLLARRFGIDDLSGGKESSRDD